MDLGGGNIAESQESGSRRRFNWDAGVIKDMGVAIELLLRPESIGTPTGRKIFSKNLNEEHENKCEHSNKLLGDILLI